MELGVGVFYQASCDDTEVDIIADYPGLLPASHVIPDVGVKTGRFWVGGPELCV